MTATITTMPIERQTPTPLTRRESEELAKLARQIAKLKKKDLEARKAQLIADAERVLATTFAADDERWRDTVKEISQKAAEFNHHIAEYMEQCGFSKSMAPGISTHWHSRGENATAARRTELRRVMQSRYEADRKAGELEIERELTVFLSTLARESLTSVQAQQLLAQMKPLQDLLPPVDLEHLRVGEIDRFFKSWDSPALLTLTDE